MYVQDKLLFEPYAMRKSLVYMVIIPPSFSNGDSLTSPLKKYFRDLSLIYKVRKHSYDNACVCTALCYHKGDHYAQINVSDNVLANFISMTGDVFNSHLL